MADPTREQRLSEILIADGALAADLRPIVLRCTVSTSTTQSSQLALTLADPHGDLLMSGRLAKGTRVRYAGLDLSIRVREVVDTSTGLGLRVTARSRIVSRMKASKGARTWSNLSPDAVARERVLAQGGKFIGEPRGRRRSIVRRAGKDGTPDEDDWALLARLASEEQAIRFDVGDTVYWGRPTWLTGKLPAAALHWAAAGRGELSPALLGLPQVRDSDDDETAQLTGTVKLLWSAVQDYGPGHAIPLTGLGDFSGRYLATSATWSPLENTGTVDIETPVDPEAVKVSEETGK